MMEIPGAEERKHELQEIDRQYPHIYWIISGILIVIIGTAFGFALFTNRDDYKLNLFTESLSVILTILVLDRRAAKRADDQLKAQLIREMGSGDLGIAKRAISELRAPKRRWLYDGSLKNADFEDAKLQGVNLVGVVMPGAFLRFADLRDADLKVADLRQANLIKGICRGTNFFNADLREADLKGANLRGSTLSSAKLQDANLHGAMLPTRRHAFSNRTVLPNGLNWTPETDMAYFTDPNHPTGFWRSDNPNSPAYRSDSE